MFTDVQQITTFDDVIDKIVDYDYGAIITHEELLSKLHFTKKSGSYYHQIQKLQRELMLRKKYLKPVHGEGYKICTADEMVEMAEKELSKATDKTKKAMIILSLTEKEEILNNETKKVYDIMVDKTSKLHASLLGGVTEVKLLKKPSLNVSYK